MADEQEVDFGARQIAELAAEFMDELEENLPPGCDIVACGIMAEVQFVCQGCGGTHTITPAKTNVTSEIHAENLFQRASHCADATWEYAAAHDDDDDED